MSGDWITIESDPGVFTELCEDIGVKGIAFEEVYCLDMLEQFDNVFGLVFLFKYSKEHDGRAVETFPPPDLFFAKQVITNACATQAVLSVLLNLDDSTSVKIGNTLTEFKTFTQCFDPVTKGLAIGNSDRIRVAHNSFHTTPTFEFIQDKSSKEDAFHFISYVPHKGVVYELDGLKEGPIKIGAYTGADWLKVVKPEIQARIEKYQQGSSEIRFNLLAVVPNKLTEATDASLIQRVLRQRALIKLVSFGMDVILDDDIDEDSVADDLLAQVTSLDSLPDDVAALEQVVKDATTKIDGLQETIDVEGQKFQKWKRENRRRKTDLMPFLLKLLGRLAAKKQLLPMYEKAIAKKAEQAPQA